MSAILPLFITKKILSLTESLQKSQVPTRMFAGRGWGRSRLLMKGPHGTDWGVQRALCLLPFVSSASRGTNAVAAQKTGGMAFRGDERHLYRERESPIRSGVSAAGR